MDNKTQAVRSSPGGDGSPAGRARHRPSYLDTLIQERSSPRSDIAAGPELVPVAPGRGEREVSEDGAGRAGRREKLARAPGWVHLVAVAVDDQNLVEGECAPPNSSMVS